MARSPAGLRNVPRQERSTARIKQILGAFETVVQRMGYDAVTTNHVAAEAGISIGTLYHWFPDKNALAEGLTEHHLDQLASELADSLVDDPELRAPGLIASLVTALAKFVAANPSVSQIVRSSSGPDSPPGELYGVIAARTASIMAARVPGITKEEESISGDACASIIVAFLCMSRRGPEDPKWAAELTYVLTAYLVGAKFPAANDPVWDAPEKALPAPVRPGLASTEFED